VALADHSVAGGTLPAKLVESMACGVPVVAAIRGEGAALIEASGAGVTTPIGDADAYANAIRVLTDDRSRVQALGAAARRCAEREFAATEVARRYLDLMQALIDA
jgi:glycosyltransferase involved in cell wall biosynthesis